MNIWQDILGERSRRLNPLRTFADHGIIMSADQMVHVQPRIRLNGMYRACNHSVPEESLTVQEALKMCTYNGYYTTFDEKERGSLEAGKIADMVILSENPYEKDVKNLRDIQVKQLLLQGRPYKPLKGSAISQVLKGMRSRSKI